MKSVWGRGLVIFLCGALVGAGVGRRLGGRFHHRDWNSPQHYNRLLERFNKKLKLSPEQKEKVGAILESNRKKMSDLHTDVRPKFEAIRGDTDAQIRALLNPDQQKTFDEMKIKWERRMKKRMGEPGPP